MADKQRKNSPLLFFYLCDSRKIHCLTREFHVKFHLKKRYRPNREKMKAIMANFCVNFNVEFPRQAMNFSKVFKIKIGYFV